MKKYKLQTIFLGYNGEYKTEEEAIKDLADKYMSNSKCDPPGEHTLEIWANKGKIKGGDISKIAKVVWFYVWEEIYGVEQWVVKYNLAIHPFKKRHWWESEKDFKFDGRGRKFKYRVLPPKKK